MTAPLSVREQVAGKRLLVVGGTGFLGKVWLCMLLRYFPEVEHVYLVCRQRKRRDGSIRLTSEERFWSEVVPNGVFEPLREQHPGTAYEDFMRSKVTPIAGDVSEDFAGVPQETRDAIRGTIDVMVNVAGVVDFTPPLDYALNANAFGMQNLIQLCQDVQGTPETGGVVTRMMHTSTCYVSGDQTGEVLERDPMTFPFPKADTLDPKDWDADREIAECVDMVEHVRHRANDAFRQSDFLDTAKQNLIRKGEPARGSALRKELDKVKRKFVEDRLRDDGTERAQFWGWHNTYTYTKSIGEQILCRSGLTFTIVRPAVIESAVNFPVMGWCEGINTSAPLIYLAMQGPVSVPCTPDSTLDIVPVDMVAGGMLCALAELLDGTHQVIYQLGTSDVAPLTVERLIELTGLFKRKWEAENGTNPLSSWVKGRLEPLSTSLEDYRSITGPLSVSKAITKTSSALGSIGGPLAALSKPASKQLAGLGKTLNITSRIIDVFIPFLATHDYRFSCANTRAAHARLPADEQAVVPWNPETMDWRHYMMEVHCPGLQRNVAPEIEKKLKKDPKALRPHDTLLDLQDEIAERHDLAPALLRTHPDGLARISFRGFRELSMAAAVRLVEAGVQDGDRVLIAGDNHPDWPIAYFGILRAGGIAVPVEATMAPDQVNNIVRTADVKLAVLGPASVEAFGDALDIDVVDMHAVADHGPTGPLPELDRQPSDIASVLFTSGTTGTPKGVMLSHANFCSLLGSLARIFPLRESDRVLSVLPLHHTFEFTCGMLLPLSRGARILYLDEINGERLNYGLKEGKITGMVGVPALWQLLERRIRSQVSERGKLFETGFDAGLELNRMLGKSTGLDLGRVFFGTVHNKLGGNIRFLISGAAALPKDTQLLFQGLGLHLAEGYGLTEAAPVLTVAKGKPGAKTGHVGQAVPGVEIKIHNPDKDGIGEVLARGPNVMQGYYGNEEATAAALDESGWLHTGDLGKVDHRGRLSIMGRAKEVVVSASGENIYLDDVENALGPNHNFVKEFALVGLDDPRGGERLGMLVVPDTEGHPELGRATLHARAKESIRRATEKLPGSQRPSVVHLVDADLPRTKTRKVQRKAVRDVLERIVAATPDRRAAKGEGVAPTVARAIAAVGGMDASTVTSSTHMVEDLNFDSLMWVELAAALESMDGGKPDADELSKCETVADVVELVNAPPPKVVVEPDVREELYIPALVKEPLRGALGFLQRELYGTGLRCKVYGRALIPQNRQTIVVSNHCSHLDMGLVKYALGPYGHKLVALAAQDYFFEGNKYWVAYFEQLTNLQPIPRKKGFRASLQQATEVVREGNVVLLFPEGTRRQDGTIGDFKPLVGRLALETDVDILPMHLEGTFEALPKGAVLPRSRELVVRIGPPLDTRELRRLTKGMKASHAARQTSALAQQAVEALRDGEVLDLSQLTQDDLEPLEGVVREKPVVRAIKSLPARYDAARIKKPISWYFSLGAKDGPRWHVIVDETHATIGEGKPPGGKADCVVKCSEELLRKMIEDGYVPGPPEFFGGAIKTNDIPTLIELSRVFDLSEVTL